MVDLSGSFWNQVYDQLSAWYKELSKASLVQLLATTNIVSNRS